MTELKRTFLLRDAKGKNVDVVATLHKLGGNKSAHFSITSQNGAAHEAIAAAAPDDVAQEVAALVRVHLCEEDGTPMHAVANGAYHLREGRYADAVRSLGGACDAEDLGRVKVRAEMRMEREGDAEVERRLNKPLVDAAKAVIALDEQIAKAERDGRSNYLEAQRAKAVFVFDAVERGVPVPTELPPQWRSKLAVLVSKGVLRTLKEFAANGAHKERVERVRKIVSEQFVEEALQAFAQEALVPKWRDDALLAKDILARPDYVAKGRPPVEQDDTTFEGFARIHRLGMEAKYEGRRLEDKVETTAWKLNFTIDNREFHESPWRQGMSYGSNPPVLSSVLESLQSDAASVTSYTEDQYLDEMGFTGSAKALKDGQQAYALSVRTEEALREALGDDAYRHFMTNVGDNPPLTESHFAEPASSAP